MKVGDFARRFLAPAVMGVVMLGCSSSDDASMEPSPTATHEQALGSVPGVPVPCRDDANNEASWGGSMAQLLLLDAVAACSWDNTWGPLLNQLSMADHALVAASRHAEALGPTSLLSWRNYRRDATNNCDPLTGEVGQAVDFPSEVQVQEAVVDEINELLVLPETVELRANLDLRSAGINYCAAQRLRSFAPGAMGAEALFMSTAEQRELLETIRERAQIAVVNYALLGAVFASEKIDAATFEYFDFLSAFSDDQRIAYLQYWAGIADEGYGTATAEQRAARKADLEAMGHDMAAAVQLLVEVTRELAELMARSRSAGEQHRGSEKPEDPWGAVDDVWGMGSWQQRLLALAYGGDPLAIVDGGPWEHTAGVTAPGRVPTYYLGLFPTVLEIPWPSRRYAPYARTNIEEPQVIELLQLARRFDVLDLEITSNSNCQMVDVDATATALFNNVEKGMQKDICPADPPFCPSPSVAGRDEETKLYKHHRIGRRHARTLASFLADMVGEQFGKAGGSCPGRYGAMLPAGRMSYPGGDTSRVHLSRNIDFMPPGLETLGGAFSNKAAVRIPWPTEVGPYDYAPELGFSNENPTPELAGYNEEEKRRLGVMSALASTRQALQVALNFPDSAITEQRQTDYFLDADKIISVIDAAIGEATTSIRPAIDRNVGLGAPNSLRVVPDPDDANRSWWHVSTAGNSGDGFWESALGTNEKMFVFATKNGWASALLSNEGEGNYFGTDAGDLVSEAVAAGAVEQMSQSATQSRLWATSPFAPLSLSTPESFLGLFYNVGGSPVTLFACRGSGTVSAPSCNSYRLMAAQVTPVDRVNYSQEFSWGGALGDFVKKQWTPLQQNPAEPSVDGFGLPTNWVPPFSAELIGGSELQSSAEHFLTLAEGAARDSADAVDRAVSNLVIELDRDFDEARDLAELAAETARAQKGMEEEVEALCGEGQTSCEDGTRVAQKALTRGWFESNSDINALKTRLDEVSASITGHVCDGVTDPPPAVPPPPDVDVGTIAVEAISCANPIAMHIAPAANYYSSEIDPEDAININNSAMANTIDCFVLKRIEDVLDSEYLIAQPVVDALDGTEGGVPAFEEYAGGSLQSSFVEGWRAISSLDEQFDVLLKSAEAVKAHSFAAEELLADANREVQRECSACAMSKAVAAGFSFGVFPSWSAGPLHSQEDQCEAAQDAQSAALRNALVARKDAMLQLATAAVGLTDKQAAIQQAGVSVQTFANQARLAKERLELEVDLIASLPTQRASNGLFRRYRNYDMWRAKALLDNARRYGVAARRAIEARYVVDLSDMVQPEPFVASPASWADEVYEYDLSLPSAVGLTTGESSGSGLFANKVVDYVGNLRGFVSGFVVNRPTAVAKDEIELVTIPGITPPTALPVEGTANEYFYVEPAAWTVQCGQGESGQWKALPSRAVGGVLTACLEDLGTVGECGATDVDCILETACGCTADADGWYDEACLEDCGLPRPERARLAFELDPWGRFNDGVMNEPYEKRYNARWDRLAVNLVGTGIKDCRMAPDPQICYADGFLRYNLSHVGHAWVTDFSGQWRALGVPLGQVEAGKALAAELWLDPLRDGWATPYITGAARTEYAYRPLGGQYLLELEAGPHVRLERLERVQLLVGSTSWVVQQ